jgi:hypothetical protein
MMDAEALKNLITEYENATDSGYKMRLANQMNDIIKKDIWELQGKIREEMMLRMQTKTEQLNNLISQTTGENTQYGYWYVEFRGRSGWWAVSDIPVSFGENGTYLGKSYIDAVRSIKDLFPERKPLVSAMVDDEIGCYNNNAH